MRHSGHGTFKIRGLSLVVVCSDDRRYRKLFKDGRSRALPEHSGPPSHQLELGVAGPAGTIGHIDGLTTGPSGFQNASAFVAPNPVLEAQRPLSPSGP